MESISGVISIPIKSFSDGYNSPPKAASLIDGGWTPYAGGADAGPEWFPSTWNCAWKLRQENKHNIL